MATQVNKKKKRWLPLESNPALMNKYINKLGVSTSQYEFCDIYGVDEGLLAMVPQPCLAVLLLFPISAAHEEHAKQEAHKAGEQTVSENVWFIKQTVGNACGTIGLLHTVANLQRLLAIDEDKFFGKFLAETKDMTPEQRADALEGNDDIEEQHEEIASDPSARSDASAPVDLHFVALVPVDGELYELDGRKATPINHGATSDGTFLKDAAKVVQQFMARDPTELRFNMTALAARQ